MAPAIREDLTPNLYRLYKEGFQFDSFYTPLYPVSTADGEYMTDTSLIPKEGVWSMHKVANHYMPYSYANVFEKLGYTSNSYHDHTASYYHRDEYLETMGYNSYLAVGTGLEERMNTKLWPNSDYEMINVTVDDYINNGQEVIDFSVVSFTVPDFQQNVIDINRGNSTVHYAGKASFGTGSLVINDFAGADDPLLAAYHFVSSYHIFMIASLLQLLFDRELA